MTDVAAQDASDPFVKSLPTRIARNQTIEINEYAAATKRLGLPTPSRKAAKSAGADSKTATHGAGYDELTDGHSAFALPESGRGGLPGIETRQRA